MSLEIGRDIGSPPLILGGRRSGRLFLLTGQGETCGPSRRTGVEEESVAADRGEMRAAGAIAVILAVLGAGCGHELPELKASAKSVTPTGSQPAGTCSGSEQFIESAWLKCIVVVRGTRRSAIAEVANRLRKRGFRMACRDSLGALELEAVRGRTRINAKARHGAIIFDESDGGKPLDVVDAKFAPVGSRLIPTGSVGLSISTDKLQPSSVPYVLPHAVCPS
jgi:hypothetical protein